MGKKITEIPFWGIFYDCFPAEQEVFAQQDESKITNEQWWTIARWWRNALMIESDWSQVSDNSLSEEQRAIWREYRQELRDLSNNFTDPKKIVFPDLPS
jgi:hypothetical protein